MTYQDPPPVLHLPVPGVSCLPLTPSLPGKSKVSTSGILVTYLSSGIVIRYHNRISSSGIRVRYQQQVTWSGIIIRYHHQVSSSVIIIMNHHHASLSGIHHESVTFRSHLHFQVEVIYFKALLGPLSRTSPLTSWNSSSPKLQASPATPTACRPAHTPLDSNRPATFAQHPFVPGLGEILQPDYDVQRRLWYSDALWQASEKGRGGRGRGGREEEKEGQRKDQTGSLVCVKVQD